MISYTFVIYNRRDENKHHRLFKSQLFSVIVVSSVFGDKQVPVLFSFGSTHLKECPSFTHFFLLVLIKELGRTGV